MGKVNFIVFQGWVDQIQKDSEDWARLGNPELSEERIMDYGQGVRKGAFDALQALALHKVIEIQEDLEGRTKMTTP